ncbi:hypothetical protein CVU37_03025 [candidate division BRC1 bacterium HGW-BRC1-1]|nr:MAG: hypothetical protein CVU37_03025 [candidate division BRC1 bacterium HGW-BRC1-1]
MPLKVAQRRLAASLLLWIGSAVFVGGGLVLSGCDRSAPPSIADVPAAEGAGMSLDVAAMETTSTGAVQTTFSTDETSPSDADTTTASAAAPIF